ncbi:MAG: hypothetical protein QGH45_15605 [Myxococcota bacterium]|nr:hypothetical protein [Myxococcota bacterium]
MTRHLRHLFPTLAALAGLGLGCPGVGSVTGPDGQPLADDECLLNVEVSGSCDG